MPEYTTPGVYVEEVSKLPPSVKTADTAIPVFIGYTEKAKADAKSLRFQPHKISSMMDYERHFGEPYPEQTILVTIDKSGANPTVAAKVEGPSAYAMHYSLQAFFANGGRSCYIVSVGPYSKRQGITLASLRKGFNAAVRLHDATLTVFPDSTAMSSHDEYYTLHREALAQAASLRDRFVVMDVWVKPNEPSFNAVQTFRDADLGGPEILRYGAAYYPRILTALDYFYKPTGSAVAVTCPQDPGLDGTLEILGKKDAALFNSAKSAIATIPMLLPAAPAVVGRYVDIDHTRGVWKAPANVGINFATAPEKAITQREQEGLNVDPVGGKSINAIRGFTGRGPALIWGARTLAGNDGEWRYISVRRYAIMVEVSIRKAIEPFVFEPADAATWVRVKDMIENWLVQQWRRGALQGTKANEAFFVHVGLSTTMTAQDILEGRMIVQIGLAVVRPAEFIILQFVHQVQT